MKRRHVLRTASGIAAAGVLGTTITGTVAADCDVVTPNGPFPPETAEENYESFISNEALYDRLHHLENRTNVEYEELGETWQGRPIPYAKVGSGDFHVFHTNQQHGDEQPATEAALRVLRDLGNGQGRSDILDELTIHFLVRHNPDGWAPADDNETPTRSNGRPDDICHDGPYFGRNQCGPADPNRQHYFQFDEETLAEVDGDAFDEEIGIPDENPSPETQAMIDKVEEVDADLIVDWHTQFTYHDQNCDMVNVSLAWPFNPHAPDDAVDLSKQVAGAFWDGVQGRANGNASIFPGGTTANICRNAYGVAGRGSVLVEQRGQAPQLNNASNGRIIRHSLNMYEQLHEEAASGDLTERDPDYADGLWDVGRDWFWRDLPSADLDEEVEEYWEEHLNSH